MSILITGGTGFIGKKVIKNLVNEFDEVILIVRKTSIYKVDMPKYNVSIITGDITKDVLEIDSKVDLSSVTDILHMAALYDIEANYSDSYISNILGTQNVISLARKCKNLRYFHYLSTVVVSGLNSGIIKEESIDEFSIFNNYYAETKMNAELLLRRCTSFKNVLVRIYRPGMVIGDSVTGEFGCANGPYYFLKFITRIYRKNGIISKIPKILLPFNEKATLPLISVDILSEWISIMVVNPKTNKKIRTYHLIEDRSYSIRSFIEDYLDFLNIDQKIISIKKTYFINKIFHILRIPKQLVDYMFLDVTYSKKNIDKDYPNLLKKSFKNYKLTIFKTAKKRFLNE